MSLLGLIPLSFFLWCEKTHLGLWIKNGTWTFATIETIHIMALAVLLGTLVVVDLRLLGFGMLRQSPSYLAQLMAPWTYGTLVVMVLTGICMFVSEANRLSQSGPAAPCSGGCDAFHGACQSHWGGGKSEQQTSQGGGRPVDCLLVWCSPSWTSDTVFIVLLFVFRIP